MISCLRAFLAASEGSTLTRVFLLDASHGGVGTAGTSAAAVITADEDNRLIKVRKRPMKNFSFLLLFCGDVGGGGLHGK